jgi:endonuclease/exonuclease/phosphatase family metal-dependent hydrolase
MSYALGTQACVSFLSINLWCRELERERRLAQLAREIQFLKPDVVCLQEANLFADGRNPVEMLAEECGLTVAVQVTGTGEDTTGIAILSRLPVQRTGEKIRANVPHSGDIVYAVISSPYGNEWCVATTHLAWGQNREPQRLKQIQNIVSFLDAEVPEETPTVLAGDFNTAPSSATVQYLTGGSVGEESAPATLWVDAHATVGDGDGWTTGPSNPWGRITAERRGMNPELLPGRRIDYLMVRGFAYGRLGSPLQCRLACLPRASVITVSDHYGVWGEFWDGDGANRDLRDFWR